jgi:hypothetical protein
LGLLLDVAPFVAVDDLGVVREEVKAAGVVEVAVRDGDVRDVLGFLAERGELGVDALLPGHLGHGERLERAVDSVFIAAGAR